MELPTRLFGHAAPCSGTALPRTRSSAVPAPSSRRLLLFTTLLLTACTTAPVSYHGILPPGTGDAYSCAVRQLNLLGYTLEDANREAGFARGRKQTSGLGTALLTGKNYHDVLTVSSFEDPTTNARTLRVTAARVEESALGFLGGERGIAPSDSGKADANELLAQCGVAEVTGPGPDEQVGLRAARDARHPGERVQPLSAHRTL